MVPVRVKGDADLKKYDINGPTLAYTILGIIAFVAWLVRWLLEH